MKHNKKYQNNLISLCITVLIVALIIFVILGVYSRYVLNTGSTEIGIQAVKCLYDFGTVEQLNYQMQGLQEITTSAVFNQLTIDNEQRTLNTYLKFKNKAVTVDVVEATSDYILYHLQTENISQSRLFCFYYHVNKHGKIDKVREVEAIDFLDSYK